MCEDLELTAGMRVLDLGCGRAKSTVFLAKEFGVDVWAVDLWLTAEENQSRVDEQARKLGIKSTIECVRAEAIWVPLLACPAVKERALQ